MYQGTLRLFMPLQRSPPLRAGSDGEAVDLVADDVAFNEARPYEREATNAGQAGPWALNLLQRSPPLRAGSDPETADHSGGLAAFNEARPYEREATALH